MDTFWDRVKYLLEKNSASRPWLAQQTNIPANTINNWIKTNRYPTVDKAAAIAKALGVSIDYLTTGRVIETVDDPDLEDICNMLRGLSRDELMMAKGMLFTMQYSQLKPKTDVSERAG